MSIDDKSFSRVPKMADADLVDEIETLRREMDQLRQRIQHLEQMAGEDTLLPIPNRRAFRRELSRLISYARRYGAGGSLLYCDLNGLKSINDLFGHAAGDEALQHFAKTLIAHTRASDMIGRLGGDEFGILLAKIDIVAAREKAKVLAGLVASSPLLWRGQVIALSCAIGVCDFTNVENVDEALSLADAAMYEEKRVYYERRSLEDS